MSNESGFESKSDVKKLDKYAELLLDVGKRNNLISFKDLRAATAEVLLPSPAELFDKFNDTSSFEVYNPKITNEDDGEENESGENDEDGHPKVESSELHDDKEAYLIQHAGKIKKQNQILLYNEKTSPLMVIKNIDKKNREHMEETGLSVAYMAFGFIHWSENESSKYVYKAPVLLLPIQLEQASIVEPYFIKPSEDEIIVNPTFAYKMDAEYGVKLPEYSDEGLLDYLEKVRKLVSKINWQVTSECKIGIFSFQKINMYRDLKDNADKILANENVRRILGETEIGDGVGMENAAEQIKSVNDPIIDLHSVVDADSSQIEAIEMAKSGKDFVLQGPPGTGKSQTITNIIAECLSDDKKVLFVSEKMSALNVVYDKLKQAGLAEFCLELHSHKANKKNVISEIYHTLRARGSSLSRKADNEITIKKQAKKQLDDYATELHKVQPVIEKSLYQLYEAYSLVHTAPDVECVIPNISERDEKYFTGTVSFMEQYVEFTPSIGYDYRKNTWYGFIGQDTSYQARSEMKSNLTIVIKMLDELLPVAREISERYDIDCNSIDNAKTWAEFFSVAAKTKVITPNLLKKANIEAANEKIESLKTLSEEIVSCRSVLDSVFDEDIYKIDGAAFHKKLTKEFVGTFSRLFDSEYKQLMKNLRMCKKDGKKLSYDEAIYMTERLLYCQEKMADFKAVVDPIRNFMGSAYTGITTDWDYVKEEFSAVRNIFSNGITFGGLTELSSLDDECDQFAVYSERMAKILALCEDSVLKQVSECFDCTIFDVKNEKLELVVARLETCLANMDTMENWCQFRTVLTKLKDLDAVSFIHAAIANNVENQHIVEAFKKQFYYQWIDFIISRTPVLSSFNRISQDRAISTFVEKDKEQFEINKVKIRAALSSKRPSTDMVASGSALAILLREGEKKRKQKSIRSLFSETGELVQRIKPCFLMSPLSVSTFLDPDKIHFDVVIFDEASQIFPQDAIGSIYRADQLIVVGDSKQMPPSNFFNASIETEDVDEEIGDVTDFESILDLCSTSMRQLRLKWHYRSRYEQLIAFSNKNFYDNELITFPSAKADKIGIGVDYYHVDGEFDRSSRTNRAEADFVVDLIFENIEKYPNRSLGVVAFSIKQQELIENILYKRLKERPEKEVLFKGGEKEPFFVKNLETVQGDERDTIIFSIAYGKDKQGRLLHNFGPLNRVGGERRLNVAVTRAKCNVQLVTSMHYTDIDLGRSSAEGVRLLREYLDYAENGNIALERSIKVNTFDQFDSDFEQEVCEFLRSNGFSVDTQVGCSGFRIDLGLKAPDSSDYVLAIECDGASYHSSKNARDRDRLRQEILERMGWKFYRIWSTDWFKNQTEEKKRLLDAARNALQLADSGVSVSAEEFQETEMEIDAFEETAFAPHVAFPPYKAADINKLYKLFPPSDFKGFIKAILDVEAPLSEELLLRRIVWAFRSEKVTSAVQQSFDYKMHGCQKYGIIRRNGFLYRADDAPIIFRVPGEITREVKHIAPEELAAGMLEILKNNGVIDKSGLYHTLAKMCGISRVGRIVNECFDNALQLLSGDACIDGDRIAVK